LPMDLLHRPDVLLHSGSVQLGMSPYLGRGLPFESAAGEQGAERLSGVVLDFSQGVDTTLYVIKAAEDCAKGVVDNSVRHGFLPFYFLYLCVELSVRVDGTPTAVDQRQ
jgi:hypothetical protein